MGLTEVSGWVCSEGCAKFIVKTQQLIRRNEHVAIFLTIFSLSLLFPSPFAFVPCLVVALPVRPPHPSACRTCHFIRLSMARH